MTREEMLQAAIIAKTDPRYMTSKAQIIEYYRDTYPGQKKDKRGEITYEWKTRIVSDLQGIAKNKQGEDMSRASIARRFQSGRESGAPTTAKARAEYAAVGQKLPPIGRQLRGDSITFHIQGDQLPGPRGGLPRKREFDVSFTGAAAQDFITSPSFPAMWEAYGVNPELFEAGEYALEVTDVS